MTKNEIWTDPGENQVAPAPRKQGSGRKVVCWTLGLVLVALAGAGCWYWWQDTGVPARGVKSVQQAGKKAQPQAKPVQATGQPAADKPQPAAEDPASTQAQPEVVDPVSAWHPGAVYSGTLGDVVRLQAGSQIARADLALKEVQVKLEELDARMLAARARSAALASGESAKADPSEAVPATALEKRLEKLVDVLEEEMRANLTKARETGQVAGFAVLAVRGSGPNLVAELCDARGTYLVRAGEMLGDLPVDEVSRQRVRLAGQVLPWR